MKDQVGCSLLKFPYSSVSICFGFLVSNEITTSKRRGCTPTCVVSLSRVTLKCNSLCDSCDSCDINCIDGLIENLKKVAAAADIS